jgi:hypothetical protein
MVKALTINVSKGRIGSLIGIDHSREAAVSHVGR